MRRLLIFLAGLMPVAIALPVFGVNCTTQAQMSEPQRTALEQAARTLAANIQSGNTSAVREQTIAAVASQFNGIANSIQAVDASIQKAAITLDNLYLLDATDLKAPAETQFFCGIAGSPLTVEITIPNLPPGKYALALVHATGVENPQQLSLVLSNDPAGSTSWKLAGFFNRPMTVAGHDGLWFWRGARTMAAKKQNWGAWFYYQTAQQLLEPVEFLSSPNLQKLQRETEQSRPDSLPGVEPMKITYNGQVLNVTDVRVGDFSGKMDLIVEYQGTPIPDPVQARAEVTAVMRTLLQQHPELKDAFHGLWVHASAPNRPNWFALELPMDQIEPAPAPGQQG
jgi:hypothetical protein